MVASPDRNDNLVRPRDFADILATPWPFHPVTISTFVAITFLPTTASELGRLVDPSLLVAGGIALISVSVLGAMLFIAGILVASQARRSRLVVLLVLMAAGALRGLIVSVLMDSSGLEARTYVWSRIILSGLSAPILLALISVVVSRTIAAREMARTTQLSIAATEQTRKQILDDIHASDMLLLEEVDGTLRPAISELTDSVSRGGARRSTIADSLSALATDLIRPLSHTLATNAVPRDFPRSPLTPQLSEASPPTYREQVSPLFLALGVFLGSGTVLVDILPLESALVAALVSGGFVYVVGRLMVGLFGHNRWPSIAVTALNSAVLAVVWLPPHIFNELVVFPDDLVFQPWVVSVIATPLLGLSYQLIVLGAYSSRNQLVRLDNIRRDMVFQLSEARRRAWLRQRHLTHTLHSSVQSRVLAEARLVRSGAGPLDESDVARTVTTLNSVLTAVKSEPPISIDPIRGIQDVVDFWAGMCAIELEFDPDVKAETDVEVCEAIQVIALEMISNAIRHGKATAMTIGIRRESADYIRITATNDGRLVSRKPQTGLGTVLFDELAVEWEFGDGKPVTVNAVVAARTVTIE
jgi:signal transduction histidine kinase